MSARRRLVISGLIVSLAMTGCTSKSHTSAAQGTVTGMIRLVGGPPPGVNEPVPGTVSVFTSADLVGKAIATAQASTSGSFTVRLSPGTYYLAATSPRYSSCNALRAVVITTGGRVQADVICNVP